VGAIYQITVRLLGLLTLAFGMLGIRCGEGRANESQKQLAISAFRGANLPQFRELANTDDTQPKSQGKIADVCMPVPGGGKRARLFSLKDKADPGDVVKLRRSGSSRTIPAIYIGEESFPPEIDEPPRSFFIYNHGGEVTYNTIPPRRTQAWMNAWLEDKGHKFLTREKVIGAFKWTSDSERKTEWLVGRENGQSFYPYSRMPSATFRGSYEVHSSESGRFIRFAHPDLAGKPYHIEQDWKAALVLNERCNLALSNPTQETRTLLALTFGITGGNVTEQIDKVRSNFVANLAQLKRARIYYYPSNSFGSYAAAATPAEPDKIRVKEAFFTDEWPSTSSRIGLYRSSTLLHEGMHLTLSSDTDSHPGDRSPEFFQGLSKAPKSIGIPYELAVKNAYCYQFFAIWLTYGARDSITKTEADELWKFLTKQVVEHPYKPGKKMRISYKKMAQIVDPLARDASLENVAGVDLNHVPGGCQWRAHLMYIAIRRRFPGVACAKVFHFGSKFPDKTTIRPRPDLSSRGRNIQVDSNIKWSWHVAPVVKVNGVVQVFDPTLFIEPVSINEWLKVQEDQGSTGSNKNTDVPPSTASESDYPYKPRIVTAVGSGQPTYVSAVKYFEHKGVWGPGLDGLIEN